MLTLASDVVLVAERDGASVAEAAEAYFEIISLFSLGRITEQGGNISLSDRFDRMALDRALSNLMRAVRELTGAVLASGTGAVSARLQTWHQARAREIDRIAAMVADLIEGELTVSRLSVAAGLLSDLLKGSAAPVETQPQPAEIEAVAVEVEAAPEPVEVAAEAEMPLAETGEADIER